MGRARPCDNCKRRKTRCIPTTSSTCEFCQRSKLKCTFNGRDRAESSVPARVQVAPLSKEVPPKIQDIGPTYLPDDYDSGVFVGCSADQDPFLVQHYEKDPDGVSRSVNQGINVIPSASPTPIVFSCFKKPGPILGQLQLAEFVNSHKNRIMAIVEPYKERLLALYFRFIDWAFPAVDKVTFYQYYYHDPQKLHTGLLSCMLAISCIYWKYDTQLCVKPIPPNLAQQLMYLSTLYIDHDMLCPNLQTIQCLLLYMQKRLPRDDVCELFGLAAQMGRLVAIAYSLGLHLDCSSWNISEHEKTVRKRLWACTYVVDKWTATTLGRPSMLRPDSSTLPTFVSKFPQEQLFVKIYELTRILDSVLAEVYPASLRYDPHFNITSPAFFSIVGKHLNILETWFTNLPEEFAEMSPPTSSDEFCRNGILHLMALTVEVLLLRVYLNPKMMISSDYPKYRQMAYVTIKKIMNFTGEITHSHLHSFWLSSCSLCFSTLAHFVFYFFVQSSAQEQAELSEPIRKWLWALRVLTNTWQEGTGLATLRMDAVFYMGKTNVHIPVPPITTAAPEVWNWQEEPILNNDIIPSAEQSETYTKQEFDVNRPHLVSSLTMDELVHDDLKDLLTEGWQYYDDPAIMNFTSNFDA